MIMSCVSTSITSAKEMSGVSLCYIVTNIWDNIPLLPMLVLGTGETNSSVDE